MSYSDSYTDDFLTVGELRKALAKIPEELDDEIVHVEVRSDLNCGCDMMGITEVEVDEDDEGYPTRATIVTDYDPS